MAVLVQQSTTEALGKLCGHSRIQLEQSGGCVGTAEYYRSTPESLLVQQSTTGWSTRGAALVQQSNKGAL